RRLTKANFKQAGKFGLVGIINTAVDFLIYNLLHFGAGLALVPANVVSTTIAMTFSFIANKRLVFRHESATQARHIALFLLVTAFGLYVLQNGAIVLLTEIWTQPLHLLIQACHTAGLNRFMTDTFIFNNGAKAAATAVSLTWNYILYRKVVFR
ncbi:MAG TPA: GtrA family protein, partial [Candidatus Saccharimonas sp.]|nr:GtrA family protein [Candidatus Saccharimonas sp.]